WWPAPLMRTRLPSLLRANLSSTNPSGTSLSSVFPFVSSRPTRRSLALSLALMIILTAGVVTFFFQVDETPRDPTSDHAEKLFDVQTIIDGQRPIFFENNTGREPMQ